jgi:hypothetical protein
MSKEGSVTNGREMSTIFGRYFSTPEDASTRLIPKIPSIAKLQNCKFAVDVLIIYT